jgi:hypothetical protein
MMSDEYIVLIIIILTTNNTNKNNKIKILVLTCQVCVSLCVVCARRLRYLGQFHTEKLSPPGIFHFSQQNTNKLKKNQQQKYNTPAQLLRTTAVRGSRARTTFDLNAAEDERGVEACELKYGFLKGSGNSKKYYKIKYKNIKNIIFT